MDREIQMQKDNEDENNMTHGREAKQAGTQLGR